MSDINASINSSNSSLVAAINPSAKIIPTNVTSTGQTASIHTGNSASVALGSADKLIPTTVTNANVTTTSLGLENVTNESKEVMFTNPIFTGTPIAPTPTSGTNTTQIATTEFVTSALSSANVGSLAGLTDTTITTIGNGEIIVYDSSLSKYVNKTLTEAGIATSSDITSAISTHAALSNPHGITKATLGLTNVEDKSSATIRSEIVDSDIPSTIARDSEVTSAISGKQDSLTFGLSSGNSLKSEEALTENDILLAGSSNVKGRTFAELKSDLSLNNVENKSSATIISEITDSDIPSTIARDSEVTSAIATHAALSNPHNITAATISLGNVTNESKATMFTNPTFTGTVSGVTKSMVGLGNVEDKSSATIRSEIVDSDIPSTITRDSELSSHVSASNPHNISTETIGLPNVDNTSDANKPISTATQTALDLKAPILNPVFSNNLQVGSLIFAESTGGGVIGMGGVVEPGQKLKVHGDAKVTGTLTVDNITVSGSGGLSLSNSPTINNHVVNKKYVDDQINSVINGAPGTLDTLNEIAAALNDSPNQISNILSNQGTNSADITTNTFTISQHTSNQNNPHNVTTAQLSLGTGDTVTFARIHGLIEDPSQPGITTLSSLSSIGTITSGTWQATPIANASIADLPTSKITSGTFDDARIKSSNITQHQGDLSIASSQLTGNMPDARIVSSNITQHQGDLSLVGTQITSGTINKNRLPSATDITSTGTLTSLNVGGQLTLTTTSGLEIQKGYFNSGGIRIKHDTSANNEFAIAYEGDLSGSGEGAKNFKLQLKKSGSQISIIKFKPDGNVFVDGGNFGVGKTSPTSKLHVSGSTTLENAVDMATGASNNYVGIGTSTKDRKLVIDGDVKIIKGSNHINNKAVLQTRADDDTGTFIDFGGPVVVTHDLFKNSSVPGGFADNSNHFHTIQKIDRITAQGHNEVKNIERVEEQYYAIQSNNLRNDKAAFWTWHRITRAIGSTDISLSNLVGWNVQADQDFNKTGANPNGRAQTEQVPFSQSQNTIFTFDTQANREAILSLNDLLRVTVTTDFIGPFVAQTHFAKVTAVSGATATVVLFAGNYKTKDELAISTDAGGTGTAQTALNDTSTFSMDRIGGQPTALVAGDFTSVNEININSIVGDINETMYVTGTGITGRVQVSTITDIDANTKKLKLSSNVTVTDDTPLSFRNDIKLSGQDSNTHTLTVIDDTTRATGYQKLVQMTSDTDHGLEINDTLTIVTDGTGGFQPAEVAHVVEKTSATVVKLVYGRLFEPLANLSLSTISGSAIIGVFKGTLDGIHRYTAGDQLFTFWSNNVGRYKSYQIGPGSQADGNCIAIGYNTYNKDNNTIKIGYDNEMLNIDSAGIDVAGTIDATGNITTTTPGGAGILKASGAIAQLMLEDSNNPSLSSITQTGGDLYYTSAGAGTDYGNHAFMTKDTTTNNTKSAIMLIDGVKANVGIGTTTPDSYYALDVTGAIRASGGNVSSLSSLNITAGLTVDTNTLHVSAPDNKVAIGTLASGTSAKGKLTVHDTGGSTDSKNRFFAISHGSNANEYVSMYYQGTAGGAPFLISREDTGGAEMVFFNNGDINLNGGYKGITSSAETSKTPDNVGIGVNAATKLNNNFPSTMGTANTNGKPTNKLHIFEKSGKTMGAITSPDLDGALVRIEESTSNNVNLYLDGNSMYGTDILVFGTNTGKDISFLPGKSESLRLKSDGKVGIGTDSPTEVLDVSGNIKTSGNITAANITLSGDLTLSGGNAIFDGDLTLNNTLAVDTDTLKVDVANDRVGINVAAPAEALDVTGNIKASGTIKSTSYEAADFPSTTTVRTTAAFKEDGTMVQDMKVIVKKVTGAEAKAMSFNTTSSWITLIPSPGANKVIIVRELEIFIDRGSWSPLSGGQVRGYGGNLELVIQTPSSQSGFQYNTYGVLQKKMLNHTINNVFNATAAVDTLIVRDAPVTQTRAYPDKPLLLRPQNLVTTSNLATYGQTPDDDYYFRITYKIVDLSSDFAVTTT